MLYISDHGSLNGAMPDNIVDGIISCIGQGICTHFNLWIIGDRFTTGLDFAESSFDLSKFPGDKILIAARNAAAFEFCLTRGVHCYWRGDNPAEFAISSRGLPLCFGPSVTTGSIMMSPELCLPCDFEKSLAGICSKYITEYMEPK